MTGLDEALAWMGDTGVHKPLMREHLIHEEARDVCALAVGPEATSLHFQVSMHQTRHNAANLKSALESASH